MEFIIEMSDFGIGYSSLNMINELPIDVLKLDMKFIQSETAKPVTQGILRFIMSLARWMNLSVVAEGVETAEQLDHLRNIGRDCLQGYYFAKPMPVDQSENLMKECNACTRIKTSRRMWTGKRAGNRSCLLLMRKQGENKKGS